MDFEPDLMQRVAEAPRDVVTMSNMISIKTFIAQWRAAQTFDEITLQSASNLPYRSVSSTSNDIPKEIREELFIVTNPVETLFCEGMAPFKPVLLSEVPEDCKLQSLIYSRQSSTKRKADVPFTIAVNKFLEYDYRTDEHLAHKYAVMRFEREKQRLRKTEEQEKEGEVEEGSEPAFLIPEAIITVTYGRANSWRCASDPARQSATRSLHVITQNTLAQFRDSIQCVRDYEIPGDFSLNPDDAKTAQPAREIFPSGMFFIEDTFYIDKRTLKAQDYSASIIEWLRKKGVTNEFHVKSMARTKFLDLSIRLGMPYVYIHQGNCEHVFQFNDIRLMTADDSQEISTYPMKLTVSFNKFTQCNVCHTRSVTWQLVNSVVSPCDPAMYCDLCFKMMHYDANGAKICDFTAHRYTKNNFLINA